MTERRKCAKGIIDSCIRKYKLQPWVKANKIDQDKAIEELKDFLTEYLAGSWNLRMKFHKQPHFNKTYRGPAIFALMGNDLAGDGKPDIRIPPQFVKGAVKAALEMLPIKIPKVVTKAINVGGVDIYARGLFMEKIGRVEAEKILADWKKNNPA